MGPFNEFRTGVGWQSPFANWSSISSVHKTLINELALLY